MRQSASPRWLKHRTCVHLTVGMLRVVWASALVNEGGRCPTSLQLRPRLLHTMSERR